MPIAGARWNRLRYTLWTPIYDLVARRLERGRRVAHALAAIEAGERVLLDGAGTGLDLEMLPEGVSVAAIDITPSMINRLRERAVRQGIDVDARVANGQELPFAAGSFDVVLLHLILAVIPDPVACIREAERVLRPGGRVSIFDKFVRDGERASAVRRAANVITSLAATDITRSLAPILEATSLRVIRDEPAGFAGLFRAVVAEKQVERQVKGQRS
ncbi:MAG: class I SAM-dependent methyltransferase [Thermoanaerobaculia bacterium]|jgi:ubiquinone/menaquinone biosynthesis C-methylase UbiE